MSSIYLSRLPILEVKLIVSMVEKNIGCHCLVMLGEGSEIYIKVIELIKRLTEEKKAIG